MIYRHPVVAAAVEPGLLSEQAYRAIRDLIVTLDLAPGAVISEADLMAKLGMGRTPVREALRALAREHLVEVYPRRGIFVAGIDARDLTALSEARSMLEPMAARLAATRLTDADREVIDTLLAELDGLGALPDERELIALDQRRHRFVYSACRNSFLESSLEDYYIHALRIWFLALDRLDHLGDAVGEHRAVLEAIRDGDGDAAARTMAEHINGFEASIRQAL